MIVIDNIGCLYNLIIKLIWDYLIQAFPPHCK